jgi:predicted amidohydrolase
MTWYDRCTTTGLAGPLAVAAGAAHWELLLRARAVECQAFVIAAAQAGQHNEKRESYGHSLIIDPWGTVIGRLEDPVATGVCLCLLGAPHGMRHASNGCAVDICSLMLWM